MVLAIVVAVYTNLAGNVISGEVVALTRDRVSVVLASDWVEVASDRVGVDAKCRNMTLSDPKDAMVYPLSIFPEREQRRIAADYALKTGNAAFLRLPDDIRRALKNHDHEIRRSERRRAKGLCSESEARAFTERARAARKVYLDEAVRSGRLTPAERSLLAD